MTRMMRLIFACTLTALAVPALADEAPAAANDNAMPMDSGTQMKGDAMPMDSAAPMKEEAKPMEPAMMQGSVARAVFTTAVKDREPVDEVTTVAGTDSQIYFYTELHGMQGQHVVHRWEYNGQVMAEVGFDVRAPRWRVWSSKNMQPAWAGKWTASVVDGSGNVVESREFTYGGM